MVALISLLVMALLIGAWWVFTRCADIQQEMGWIIVYIGIGFIVYAEIGFLIVWYALKFFGVI